MRTRDFARKRVANALTEIERLRQGEFPYQHSSDALSLLEDEFKRQEKLLAKLTDTTDKGTSDQVCSTSLDILSIYVPILGFILRSTNVRNAFESYAPLLRLAWKLLNPKAKLLLSSEWDYSPFVYLPMDILPDFVLIGMPATESGNPLVLPCAGHELGHHVWSRRNCSQLYSAPVEERIVKELADNHWDDYIKLYPLHTKAQLQTDMFVSSTWQPAFTWALLQMEEIFCDFMGLMLFAESYLHAFSFLIAPGSTGERSVRYPNMKSRVTFLDKAAKDMDILVPDEFIASFEEEREEFDPTKKLLLSIADVVAESFIDDLIAKAKDVCTTSGVPSRSRAEVERIAKEFHEKIVPCSEMKSLSDIVNAGWMCYQNEKLWNGVEQINEGNREKILIDLILKTIEVLEIETRVPNAH